MITIRQVELNLARRMADLLISDALNSIQIIPKAKRKIAPYPQKKAPETNPGDLVL
jgi:hypothetical protein